MANTLPRGLRNCNPGNLRRTGDKWQGLSAQQTDKEFFQFREMKWGYRALIKTLQTYITQRGCKTVKDIITRWAPEHENNTQAYILRVCNDMQVPTDYTPDADDKGSMCALAAAISAVENGRPANMNDIYKGWELL